MIGLLTPDEARTRECPLIRYCENAEQVIHERMPALYSHANCRGPDCIGWRWSPALTVNNPMRAHDARGNQVGQSVSLTHGYCGFAGRPE